MIRWFKSLWWSVFPVKRTVHPTKVNFKVRVHGVTSGNSESRSDEVR